MSHPIGTYSFLPWLRHGLANEIQAGASESGRAVVNVQLLLKGTPVTGSAVVEVPVNKPVALFGPGDLQGIDSRAIVRVEPRNWSTNFETNYFPFIEFYDEDFAWRYSPATPDARQRLQPWLALIVLEEREQNPEFTEGRDVRNKPLPYVEVTDTALFPPPAELWAWAHVHVNRNLGADDTELVSEDMPAVLQRLRAVLNENPDLAYSRILCPRKLDANKAYQAFLMPSFESGRRAGLNLDPFADPALPAVTTSAWENYTNRPEPTRYPYYHRWYFRTGGPGDFESLVRLLKPKPVDSRVGRRDMDTQFPGSNVDGVQVGRPDLNGVLKLGGALRVPDSVFTDTEREEFEKYENWATPFPQPIQEDLATIVNLADDYAGLAAGDANLTADILDEDDPTQGDADPVITPPLYGTWHALTKRLLVDRAGAPVPRRTNWVHELNLDPRFRVAAGFGTRVVQDQQEKYMDAAWEQIGRVLEANQRIRRGQLAKDVSTIWYDRHLRPLLGVSRQSALLLMAPLNKRVLQDGVTVHQHLTESLVQPTMTTGVLRRVVRPRGRLLKALPFSTREQPGDLLERVNRGEVSAAPPKVTPPGVNTIADVANAVTPQDAPPFVIDLLRRFAWLCWLPLLLALLIVILLFLVVSPAIAVAIGVAAGAAAFFLFNLLSRWSRGLAAADAIGEDTPSPESVDDIPTTGDFVITEPGSGFTPTPGPTDSFEAARFRTALRDVYTLLDASAKDGTRPPKKPLDLRAVATRTFEAIDPQKTIPRRLLGTILLPPRIRGEIGDELLVEAMAYPEFDTPMYEPLKNISSELFLPNLTFIEQNSITVLKTNQKFIESYMVGLNHEFARELLWREYPTDQRGSYFRQFWDVSSFLTAETSDPAALKETLRDIPPLDKWLPSSPLGSHDHREVAGETEEEIVLVIRGELLKRYPTAVIYAHRACWQRRDDGTAADQAKNPCSRSGAIDDTKERRLAPLDAAEEDNPPRTKVLTPLYQAKIDPDIYFFGFDLDEDEARGGTGEPGDEDPGWFFVIKERPGEPRFGLDIDAQPQLNVWNDLSWSDVQPGAPGSYININDAMAVHALVEPPPEDEKRVQFLDDQNISWNANMSSADLAYIVFQAPVLVAVHAKEMLPRRG